MIINLDKIHPCKREKVLNGLKFIEERNSLRKIIDKVVLFGSSVTDDCSDESDIDICLFSYYNCSDREYFYIYSSLETVIDNLCDIFNYYRTGPAVRKYVDSKGVTVYVI